MVMGQLGNGPSVGSLRKAVIGGMLGLGLLASGGVPKLQGQSPTFRSAGARRSLPSDERPLPRYTERATHRGYEVSTGKIVVIATTNLEDARQAAAQAAEAWDETALLADHWMTGHRQPNFGQGAVQVVIGGDRVPLQQESSATVARFDRVTQIVTGGGGAGDDSSERQRQLHQAVALAFFQTAELDHAFPEWVSHGLAAYIAGNRPPSGADNAAARVLFLLEGNDGSHAGPFFSLLADQWERTRPDPDRDFQRRNGSPLPPTKQSQAVEQFVADLASEWQQWQLDPEAGQLQIAAGNAADDHVEQAQQAMAFVLKLTDRFAVQGRGGIGTKVTMFDKATRTAANVIHPAPAHPPSLSAILTQAAAAKQRWATIGPDGKLIWSHEEEKLRQLLGVDDQRYQFAQRETKWVLETTLSDGRKLAGWLEPNSENARRPLAKFSVTDPE